MFLGVLGHDLRGPLNSVALSAGALARTIRDDPDAADTWIQTAINPQDPAFVRALAGGVTTMQVLPGSDPVFGGRSVVLKPIPEPTVAQMVFPDAPRGLKMACGENPKSTDAAMKRGPTSRQGEIAYIRATLTEFGTAAQPNKPARAAFFVHGLAAPGAQLEIEFIAAK